MKRVMGSSGELLRIENGKYYIANEDFGCMQEVDLERFKEEVKSYKDVCTNTWSKELKQQYEELVDELRKEVN